MEYEQAKLGRTFILKFAHGEDFLTELKTFVKEQQIKAGTIQLLGALAKAGVVVGPKKDELPVTPIEKTIDHAHEIIGIGTIFWENDEPKIHIHTATGHDKDVLVTCIRKDTEVFIVIEAIVQEYTHTSAKRRLNERTKMSLLTFDSAP